MSTSKMGLVLSREETQISTQIETYLEMDKQIVEILRLRGDYVSLYAALRIEGLEQELKEAKVVTS